MYKISGIYQIQSKIKPERIYIGSSVNIHIRWNYHHWDLKRNKHHSAKLQKHFNKYGESDLEFTILLACNKEDLIKTEQYFLDSYKPYFNNYQYANSRLGVKHTEKTKQKQRVAKLGKKHTLESILKMKGNTNKKGKRCSEKTKELVSKANKGRIVSIETRKKMSAKHKSIGNSPKIKFKIGNVPWNKGKTGVQDYSYRSNKKII